MELFFDTETSGFISDKKDLDAKDQGWVVQLGFILSDADQIYHECNLMIKANGRLMNPFAEKVHGISADTSEIGGLYEVEVFEIFRKMLLFNPTLICHNVKFDFKFIYHLYMKYCPEALEEFTTLPAICTMNNKEIKTFCGLKNAKGHAKVPKLIELYDILFNESFPAHDALADVRATRRSFYELIKRGVITNE